MRSKSRSGGYTMMRCMRQVGHLKFKCCLAVSDSVSRGQIQWTSGGFQERSDFVTHILEGRQKQNRQNRFLDVQSRAPASS